MTKHMLDPLHYYNTVGAKEYVQHASAYFDELVLQSGINVSANSETVDRYTQIISDETNGKKRKHKWLAAYIGLIVAICVLAAVEIALLTAENVNVLGWLVLPFAAQITCAWLVTAIIHPSYRKATAEYNECHAEAEIIQKTAWEQMEPLNKLFSGVNVLSLVEKTIPDLKFLPVCSADHVTWMACSKGFQEPDWTNTSILNVQSGTLNGNPFLLTQQRTHRMGVKEYTGSITISWTEIYYDTEIYYETEVYYDAQGNRQERQIQKTRVVKKERLRSEPLEAKVRKPIPCYSRSSTLGYIHYAAPDLTFTRKPQHSEKCSEAGLDRRVKKRGKALRRKSERAIRTGDSFQVMENMSFETLFGATDRNHEVQYRALFTPRAQRNMVRLMTSRDGFGDDFLFRKNHCYNEICCDHASKGFTSLSPDGCRSYSLETARMQFLDLSQTFFKELFFYFAPLLAIPSYQDPGYREDLPDGAVKTHFSRYEHEAIANVFPWKDIVPDGVKTECLLHAKLLSTTDCADIVQIESRGYKTRERCDYVRKLGEDNEWHDVPVYWTEYIPAQKSVTISVEQESEENRNSGICLHGLVGKIIQDNKED